MLLIGLTGGIGSGKTAASREFARLGATVIDTDQLARELVEPGQPALADIISTFGGNLLDTQHHLDRARLREIVFSDPAQRMKLEAILHPRIRERAMALARQSETPYCVLVIPLLVETAGDYPLDRILVIDAPLEIQRQRVQSRDQLSDEEIMAILKTQANREQRLEVANDVITNDAGIKDLEREIGLLHQFYLGLVHDQGTAPAI